MTCILFEASSERSQFASKDHTQKAYGAETRVRFLTIKTLSARIRGARSRFEGCRSLRAYWATLRFGSGRFLFSSHALIASMPEPLSPRR